MNSPLSKLAPQKIRDLPRQFLLEQLEEFFRAVPPAGIVETDYALWRCAETGLEFCEPALPGSVAFYEWVSSFPSYYPGTRWEYGEVARRLQSGEIPGANEGKILDVNSNRRPRKGDTLST
jgi:hypothetical protein